MLTGTKTIYFLKCDFCGETYETSEPPIRSSFIHTVIDTVYDSDGKSQERTEQYLGYEGHMCPTCFGTLERMWTHRKCVMEEKTKADMAEPLPPDFLGEEAEKEDEDVPSEGEVKKYGPYEKHTCKNCAHCAERTGAGRGSRYRCGLSDAWFGGGLSCDAWRRMEKEDKPC